MCPDKKSPIQFMFTIFVTAREVLDRAGVQARRTVEKMNLVCNETGSRARSLEGLSTEERLMHERRAGRPKPPKPPALLQPGTQRTYKAIESDTYCVVRSGVW